MLMVHDAIAYAPYKLKHYAKLSSLSNKRNFSSDDEKKYPIYRKFSEGRIKNEKTKIDLFIWLDEHEHASSHLLFNETNKDHYAALCKVFSIDYNEIKKID